MYIFHPSIHASMHRSIHTHTHSYTFPCVRAVKGKAGRSSLIKFMIAVGAGIGLLSCANFMCDFILQYLMPANDVYMESKFEEVSEDEREREILRRRNTVSRNSTDGKNDHSVDGGHRRGSSSRNGRSDVYDFPDRSSVGNQGNGDTKLNVVGSYYQSFDSKTE